MPNKFIAALMEVGQDASFSSARAISSFKIGAKNKERYTKPKEIKRAGLIVNATICFLLPRL